MDAKTPRLYHAKQKTKYMKQDKNFTVRLKAAIDKRLMESGVTSSVTLSIDEYSTEKQKALYKFMESLGEITLDYLQGASKKEPDTTINKINQPQLTTTQLSTLSSMANYWDEISKRDDVESVKQISASELIDVLAILEPIQILLIIGSYVKQQA